jgi:hypothetical protein
LTQKFPVPASEKSAEALPIIVSSRLYPVQIHILCMAVFTPSDG